MSGGNSSSHSQSLVFGCPSSPTFSTTSAPLAGNLFAPSTPSSTQSPFSCSNNASASTTATPSVTMAAFPSTTTQSAFGLSTTPSFTTFGNPVFTSITQGTGSMTSSSSSLSNYPAFSSFGNTNPPKSPMFGCGFLHFNNSASASSSAPTKPAPGFDFSSTPLFCFLNFPPTSSTSPSRTPSIFNRLTSPFAGQQSTPTPQASPSCEHTSLWGQHWGSRVAAYTPTSGAELEPFPSMLNSTLYSISAMPIYKDKSHEELRWHDHKSQGQGQGRVTPACESATSGQLLLALPVFVLPAAMPTFSISGFGSVPWTPSLGSTVPAFAVPPTLLGVPWTNAPVLGQPSFSASSSTPVMPAVFSLCEMFRRL